MHKYIHNLNKSREVQIKMTIRYELVPIEPKEVWQHQVLVSI